MRAAVRESFYTVSVTAAELWQTVGKILERRRQDRRWRPIDIERVGGPSYKTVQAIEDGAVGNIESLDKHARALDLSLVDILHEVLVSTSTPLSPEAAHIVRRFALMTVASRAALLAIANALPVEAEPLPTASGAAAPPGPNPPRPARPRRVRRTTR